MATVARSSSKATGTTHTGSSSSSKKSKNDRNDRICSLGHKGHTDDYCRIQIQNKLDESEKRCKELTEKAEKAEVKKSVAHCTTIVEQPTYWDDAFMAGSHSSIDTITLDTAATSMMFGNRDPLQSLTPIPPREIRVASKGNSILAHHKGTFDMGGYRISNVLYSPKLAVNLISAGLLYDSGHDIKWSNTAATVFNQGGKMVMTFKRDPVNSRLWQTTVRPPEKAFAVPRSMSRTDFATLWHRRLGHLHPAAVVEYLKGIGIQDLSTSDFSLCDACSMGKAT